MDDYKKQAKQIKEICTMYHFQNEIEEVDQILQKMEEFRLRILFTGSFSAGKSAAINTLLERDLLREKQAPETVIASELAFGDKEYGEIVCGENRTPCSLEELEQKNSSAYDYYVWHINNDNLKKLSAYTLVDMPGYNSGIENHNKAILRYIGMGNAYVLTIDCEDGEIKESLLQFMDEIRNYNHNLAIVLTKTDKKIPREVEEIAENILFSAKEMFGETVKLVSVSKYDPDSAQKLVDLISGFDVGTVYQQTFAPQLYEVALKASLGLQSLCKALTLDNAEIQKEIRHRRANQDALREQFRSEKARLSRDMQNRVRPAIIADAGEALYAQADSLASALVAGGIAFTSRVNNILRGVLVSSTCRNVELSFNEFVEGLDLSALQFDSARYFDLDVEEAKKKLGAARTLVSQISTEASAANGVYKAVTTALAITTSVVAPWLELILIFLPDVIKLFSGMFGQSQEEQMQVRIKTKLHGEIIPQILAKLEPEIDQSLEQLQDKMVQDCEDNIRARIEIEISALEQAENQLKENDEKFQAEATEIKEALEQLQQIIVAIE